MEDVGGRVLGRVSRVTNVNSCGFYEFKVWGGVGG
jgi:hypothetical protein